MVRTTPGILVAAAAALAGVGCSVPEETVEATSPALRSGGAIHIPGTDGVPPGVDPSQSYAESRAISILERVGRLSLVEKALVDRADGMIAGTRDGRVSIDELAQLAHPDFFAVLSPGEKQALPGLWRVMKAPQPGEVPHVGLSVLSRFSLDQVQRVHGVATALVRPAERNKFRVTEVATFGSWAEPAADRIQYGFDDDSDPSTITIADVEAAKLSTAYTPAEIDTFDRLGKAMRVAAVAEADAALLQTPKTLIAEALKMPSPTQASEEEPLPVPSNLAALIVFRDTTYREKRFRNGANFSFELFCDQTFKPVVMTRNNDVTAVELDIRTEQETLAAGNAISVDPHHGAIVSLWRDGEERARVRFAADASYESEVHVDIAELRGYALVTSDGPLYEKLEDTRFDSLGLRSSYLHQLTDPGSFGQEPADWRRALHPEEHIGQGIYDVRLDDGRTLQVIAYPTLQNGRIEGGVAVRFDGKVFPMYPALSNGSPTSPTWRSRDPSVQIALGSRHVEVTVDSSPSTAGEMPARPSAW